MPVRTLSGALGTIVMGQKYQSKMIKTNKLTSIYFRARKLNIIYPHKGVCSMT